jgi:hypothetical protein
MLLIYIIVINNIMILVFIQVDFKPADIKHSSLLTMAKHVRHAMLQGNHEVFKKAFAEGTRLGSVDIYDIATYMMLTELDGKRIHDFYWTDPIDVMKRSVAKLQCKGICGLVGRATTFVGGDVDSIPTCGRSAAPLQCDSGPLDLRVLNRLVG